VQQVMNTALRSPTTATLLKEMDSVGIGRGHEGDDACIG
jgi:DNA topoisomerase IA